MTKVAALPPDLPHLPSPYDEADRAAIKAVAMGNASPDQQQRALRWIIETCAGLYDISFRPGADGGRLSDFAEGKRWVGSQIVKLTKLPAQTQKDT